MQQNWAIVELCHVKISNWIDIIFNVVVKLGALAFWFFAMFLFAGFFVVTDCQLLAVQLIPHRTFFVPHSKRFVKAQFS